MAENFVTLDRQAYDSLQQELAVLRQQVVCLQQEKMTQPFQLARQRTLFNVISTIRASLDLNRIFKTTATEIRQLLNADRVGIFRFEGSTGYREGEFIAEDVQAEYMSALATKVGDRCFSQQYATEYAQGQIQAIADIYDAGLSDCHIAILAQFQVRANLVIPLLLGEELWGLLCIHQCSGPRQWQREDIEFMLQVAAHLSVALQQAQLLAQTQQQASQLQALNLALEAKVQERTAELMKVNQALEVEIAERKLAELALRQLNEELEARVQERTQKLRASEARFQKLAANIPGMIYQFRLTPDRVMSFTYTSPGVRDLFELEPKQRDRILELVYPEDRPSLEAGIARSAQTLETFCWEGRFTLPSGQIKWIQAISRPERQADGAIEWDGLMVDISERQAALHERNQAEAERDRFFNLSADLLCMAGFDGYFKRINPAFESTLGYTEAELFAQPFLSFVHPEDIEATMAEASKLSYGEKTLCFENRYRCKDGSYRWLAWTSVPVVQDSAIYAIARDITEQKEVEEALRRSEERFRCLTEATAQIIWHTEADGQIKTPQLSLQAFTGQTHEETQGWRWLEAIHPQDRKRIAKVWKRAIAKKSLYQVEYRLQHRDGEYRYVSARAIPILNADGSVREWIGTCYDISDRKAAEQQILETKNLYQQILDAIPDLVLCKGEASRIIYANHAFRDYYGMTVQELQGLIDAPFANPDYTQQYVKDDAYVFNTGNPLKVEEVVVRHDGEERLFSTVKTAIFNRQGKVIQTVGVSRDITERKQDEEALRLYKHAVESSSDAIGITDAEGNHFYHNPAFASLYEYETVEDFNDCGGLTAVFTNPKVAKDVLQVMRTGKTWVGEIEQRTKSDRLVQILLRADAIKDATGEIIGFMSVNTDITERKQAERQLQQQTQNLENTLRELQRTQTQLVQSEKMSSLGHLVAGVAHEINNPVNFIYGNLIHANQYANQLLEIIEAYQHHYPNPAPELAELIEDVELDFLVEDLPKLINSMQVGAQRIREIITSLRNFSRLDEAEVKEVDIHEGIESTLMILHNRLKAKPDRLEIEVRKNYANLPKIECYPGQLNQVFMNILVNAIDALEERDKTRSFQEFQQNPSMIDIVTEFIEAKSQIEIRIIDNGPGIPCAVKKHIFDPFFTTKAVGKGTGLGMSISYQIVTEKHKGSLECYSSQGKGTEFVIQIPTQPKAV